MFEVLMTGVGDAFSTQHWGTHFLLRKDDYVLAVDCPDSYRRALRSSGFEHNGEPLDAHHIDAMILTHLHGDHVNGLEMLACYLRFAHERKLPLYTTQETATVAQGFVGWADISRAVTGVVLGCPPGRLGRNVRDRSFPDHRATDTAPPPCHGDADLGW